MIKNYSGYSWKQIEQIENKEDCILILPISSLEQHGIQLPLGTDDIILQKILDALIDNPSVIGDYLLLPALHYGLSPEHMDFSGTITLSPKTLISVIEDIIQSIKKHGFNK
ncbi:MAG TPA: creatininase family protein, partial [Methanocorpusculum sp.]|nr:creatininase family protein [Methanocorpusculum sp.]